MTRLIEIEIENKKIIDKGWSTLGGNSGLLIFNLLPWPPPLLPPPPPIYLHPPPIETVVHAAVKTNTKKTLLRSLRKAVRTPNVVVGAVLHLPLPMTTVHLAVKIDQAVAQGSINTNIDTKRRIKTRGRLNITANAISVK